MLNKVFKKEEKDTYLNNIPLILETVNKEVQVINLKLHSLIEFIKKKDNNKRIMDEKSIATFIQGSIHILYFAIKFINTYKACEEFKAINQKLSFNIKDLESVINKIKKTLETCFDTQKDKFLNKLELLKSLSLNGNIEYKKDENYCSICLHKLILEPSTNIFNHDIHLTCVNLWLNLVSISSPFII